MKLIIMNNEGISKRYNVEGILYQNGILKSMRIINDKTYTNDIEKIKNIKVMEIKQGFYGNKEG